MTHYPVESTCYTKTIKEWSLLTTMLTLWYLDNIQVPLKISQCVTKALHSITTPAAAG